MLAAVSLSVLLLLAVVAPLLGRRLGAAAGWWLAIPPAALTVAWGLRAPDVISGQAVPFVWRWVPALDVSFALRADGLSLLFALLVLGVGSLVLVYAAGYMRGKPRIGRFYAILLGFAAAMLGVVLSESILLLYVFWELTSITSFLLIGHEHESEPARDAAQQALLVTVLGGLSLLAGLLLLGVAADAWTFSGVLAQRDAIAGSPLGPPAMVFILLGAFTKSAIVPFHFWLPNAMQAPTPVSAYLHSSTMVKAGIYLVARLQPALAEVVGWAELLVAFGGVTAIVAGLLATRAEAFKEVLAYSTASSLGMMLTLIPLGEKGAVAAMAYLLAHAMFKGALFLIAGVVTHETGETEIPRTGRLARAMPWTAAAAVVAGASIAGIPGMLGFSAKETLLKGSVEGSLAPGWTAAAVALGGLFSAFVGAWTVWRPFFAAREVELGEPPHRAPLSMSLGPGALGLGTLVAGLAPMLFAEPLVRGAASVVLGSPAEPPAVHLDLLHALEPGLPLALGGAALLGGLGLYAARRPWRRWTRFLPALARVGPARGYHRTMAALQAVSNAQTRLLQSGYLRWYVRVTFAAMLFVVAPPVGRALLRAPTGSWGASAFDPVPVLMVALVSLGGLATTAVRSRLAAAALLGLIGFGIAVAFAWLGAPDLAMTQFSVDTLFTVLFVLIVYRLPRFSKLSSHLDYLVDAILAIAVGCTMAALALLASTHQLAPRISGFFAEESYTRAHGKNVVNVILVDFRVFDTMGEIFVLTLAAAGVYVLLRGAPEEPR